MKINTIRGTQNGPTSSLHNAVITESQLRALARSSKPSQDHDVFKIAIASGLLPPMPNPYHPEDDPIRIQMSGIDFPDVRAIRMSTRSRLERRKFSIDWDQLEHTPELCKPQISFHSWHFLAGYFPMTVQNHELAKFIVHRDEVGIVYNIQTGLNMFWNVGEDPVAPDWRWPRGDPFYYTRPELYSTPGTFPIPEIMWHLRIERVDPEGVDPQNWRTFPPDQLPGTPYKVLPQWDEMMFMYGEDHSVHFVLPQNTVLSLWIQRTSEGNETPIRDVSGLLQGFTQTQGSDRTFENVTSAYGI